MKRDRYAVHSGNPSHITWNRRTFVKGLGALASSAAYLGYDVNQAAAEPPPETTTIKLIDYPSACLVPQYMADQLLRAEGFTDVRYPRRLDWLKALVDDDVNLTLAYAPTLISAMDDGAPVVFLAGIHLGCYDLFGGDSVRTVRDLKGKTVGVTVERGTTHLFISSMAAYVGLDPAKDINFVTKPVEEAKRLFLEGKLDAFMSYPPTAQEFKANKVGNLVVNGAVDRPWSQHYCCIVSANKEFVRRNPVATKRALRAILKATDICASQPERAAQFLVSQGHAARYDYAYQMMKELNYNVWREYESEDSVRFWALRLHDAGMIKSSPEKIIARNTDWRFLNELKRELKT